MDDTKTTQASAHSEEPQVEMSAAQPQPIGACPNPEAHEGKPSACDAPEASAETATAGEEEKAASEATVPTSADLTEKLAMLRRLLSPRAWVGTRRDPIADTSRGQGRILALLKLRDGLSTKEMAAVLDLRISSLNETLAKMERAGLIERIPSATDRRVMLIHLTEQGRATEQPDTRVPDPFASFSNEERTQFGALLDRAIETVRSEMDPETLAHLERVAEARRSAFEGTFEERGPRDGRDDRGRRSRDSWDDGERGPRDRRERDGRGGRPDRGPWDRGDREEQGYRREGHGGRPDHGHGRGHGGRPERGAWDGEECGDRPGRETRGRGGHGRPRG